MLLASYETFNFARTPLITACGYICVWHCHSISFVRHGKKIVFIRLGYHMFRLTYNITVLKLDNDKKNQKSGFCKLFIISIGHFIPNDLIQKLNLKLFQRSFHKIVCMFNVKAPKSGKFIDVVPNNFTLMTSRRSFWVSYKPSFKPALSTFHQKQPLVARVEATVTAI